MIAYAVSARTREIGVRMALGATASQWRAEVLRETQVLADWGIALGTVASCAAAATLRTFLFGVTSLDPATFAGVFVVLVCVAGLAGYLPACRALRIDPVQALRAL